MSAASYIEHTGNLVRRVFELLEAHPEGLTIKALVEQIGEPLFSNERRNSNHIEETLRRSCIAPLNAGWLICRHGYHLTLSTTGKEAYKHYENPTDLIREAGRLSTKGWLSLRFPRAYYFLGKIKDQSLAELRAGKRVGLKRLMGRTLKARARWERILPIQQHRRLIVPHIRGSALLAHLDAHGTPYREGGHAIYLPTGSFRNGAFKMLADDYPTDAGLKIMKNPGGIDDSRYIKGTNKGDSQIHLRFVHNHAHLMLVANLLNSRGICPRLYDLVELQCGDQLLTAYVVEHVAGEIPSLSQCEAGIQGLRDLEAEGLIKVILPEGFNDEEFECPNCCNNALLSLNGEFRYVDFQNFILINYQNYLKKIAEAATEASHFGDTTFLRGGRYLYQSVPGVDLPGKRSIEDRMALLGKLMDSAAVSIRDRLVLDIGCNIGMMMAQYLKLGAHWCHGWDFSHITPHTDNLLRALGCTRFSTTGSDISMAQCLEEETPAFLKRRLDGCVISYLAVRAHLGWLEALGRIPWKFLIYEGHEGEDTTDFDRHMEELRKTANFRVAAREEYADGDSDRRTVAILLRS